MARIRIFAAITAAILMATVAGAPLESAAAQDYPNRPITMIVPYPAGGGVDAMGRIVGQKLSASLGQQVVIENRGGAGGMIGTRDAAKSAPDGYTIVILLTGLSLGNDPGYDLQKDFAPIGLVASTPMIVVSNLSFPAKSLADVITLAKKDPGKYSDGTPPAPTMNYFAAALFNLMAGVDITIVTYKGTGPLTTDLLGGHVPLGVDTIPASGSNIQAGQLRGLAVADSKRSAALPSVPTSAESGLPGFEAVQYYGLAAPAGTPRPIVERLNKELRAILMTDASSAKAASRHRARQRTTPPICSARKASGRRWSKSSD
jgi:tripartite-type tricarboxylate transporter receptor subunit TctC